MSPDEFDQLLHDTEVKLARLRALYEQYFQGIEKLEPHVARKDMDRAMEFVKKNLPRNTALRFRTQQLAARYGTYITYWQRIARQIEEGTFKRDVMRAQKSRAKPERAAVEEPSAWEIEVDIDAVEESDPLAGLGDPDVDAILGALGNRASARPQPAAAAAATPTPTPPATAAAKPAATPKRTGLTAFGAPLGKARPTDNSPAPRALPGAVPPKVAAPAPVSVAKPAAAVVPKPAAPTAAAPAPAVLRPAPTVTAPAVPQPVVAKPAPAQAAPQPVVPRPAAAPQPTPNATPRPAATFARPQGATPVVAKAPTVDLQDLYSRYADARKKNNEGAVRFETLKESVDKMMPKLREKYGDRRVDFDVVVQNGRVGLKPKVGE